MRELVLIDSASEHACGQPTLDRWHVFEPVSGRWTWMSVFGCCDLVAVDPVEEHETAELAPQRVKRAA